jgi:myo-inositol-1(or 4)-monophosphatase
LIAGQANRLARFSFGAVMAMAATEPQLLELQVTAEEAAARAGQHLRAVWQQPRQLSQKGLRDWVTDADIAAQAIITDLVRSRFPDHGFLTEEEDESLARAGSVIWVIDPLDGTTNYSRQQPNYAVSIAAAARLPAAAGSDAYQMVVGVIYDPARDELFSAALGQGATGNGRPLRSSSVASLANAIVAADWCHGEAERRAMVAAVNTFAHDIHSLRGIGSAALALAWIAAGRLDGYVQLYLNPWDAAAGSLLIAEAGGVVHDRRGRDWTLHAGGCVASNGLIQAQLEGRIGQSAGG